MNLSSLIKQYFPTAEEEVTIDVFDEKTVDAVYRRVVKALMQHMDIEQTVLDAFSYCFYEMLDNVIIHTDKQLGTVLTHYNQEAHTLSILIADDGIGVQASLAKNEKYRTISEEEALKLCIKDKVTDGAGMGFGLYSTSLLDQKVGLRFEIRSGNHTMQVTKGVVSTKESVFWQGTIVYMQLQTDKEIDPQEVVAYRTDVTDEFDTIFLNDNELEQLW
jgi:anti-sigma regulatory factor (Ser/Thr protein kinase)